MSDIFISYSHEDFDLAQSLALVLIDNGWSVWFDRSGIRGGGQFDEQIEDAISAATVALVIWSNISVKSRWVRAEASFAADREKLIPILADTVNPPLQFVHLQGFDFSNWTGEPEQPVFRQLCEVLSKKLDQATYENNAEYADANPISSNLPAKENAQQLAAKWPQLLPGVDSEFVAYFRDNTFPMVKFTIVLAFVVYSAFGLVDFFASRGGVEITRFRFMVGGPVLLILVALSFSRIAVVYSEQFTALFVCVGSLLVFFTLRILYHYAAGIMYQGAATMDFMIVVSIVTLIPLRLAYAGALILFVFILHAIFIAGGQLPDYVIIGDYLCLGTVSLVGLAIAYFRERYMRIAYLEKKKDKNQIEELKQRIIGRSQGATRKSATGT